MRASRARPLLLCGPSGACLGRDGDRRRGRASAIALVTSRGIFPGTPATFRPADPLTRAELAGLLSALGEPARQGPGRTAGNRVGGRPRFRPRRGPRPAPGGSAVRRRRPQRRTRPAEPVRDRGRRPASRPAHRPRARRARSCSPNSRRRGPRPRSRPPASSRSEGHLRLTTRRSRQPTPAAVSPTCRGSRAVSRSRRSHRSNSRSFAPPSH